MHKEGNDDFLWICVGYFSLLCVGFSTSDFIPVLFIANFLTFFSFSLFYHDFQLFPAFLPKFTQIIPEFGFLTQNDSVEHEKRRNSPHSTLIIWHL